MSSNVLGEKCEGCGGSALKHPWVLVHNDKSGTTPFIASPVCHACHVNPEHRKKKKLVGHFFTRQQAQQALSMAGSASIGG
jgi:hypothetical protein